MAIRGEAGGGDCLNEGEGISQGTYMKDPWTWTMVWRLTMEVRGVMGGVGHRGKIWDNCNGIINKIHIFFKIRIPLFYCCIVFHCVNVPQLFYPLIH